MLLQENNVQKARNLFFFFICLYCFLTLFVTSLFYITSIFLGYEGLGIPLFGGADDGRFYYVEALRIAENSPAVITSSHTIILGELMKFFHTNEVFFLKTFNAISNVCTLFIALKIMQLLQSKNELPIQSIFFILCLTFYPSYMINTNISILRDTWIVFYYLLAILCSFQVFRNPNPLIKVIYGVGVVFSLWMLVGYRNYALLAFIISTMLYMIGQGWKKGFATRAIVIGGSCFIVFYTFFFMYPMPIVNRTIQEIAAYRLAGMTTFGGNGQLHISLDQSNIVSFLSAYLYSSVSNAIGPFPWQVMNSSSALLFLSETIGFSMISLYLIKRRRELKSAHIFLIVHSIVWFLLIGFFNDNIGTAARLRMIGWIILFLVFSSIYQERFVQAFRWGSKGELVKRRR